MNERKKGKLFRFAVDLFCSTLKQVTKRDFEYRCNKADIAAWDNFIEHYGERVGENFIREYNDYGFQSWFNDTCEKDYSTKIHFNWIYGKKGIQRHDKVQYKVRKHYVRKELKLKHKVRTGKVHNNLATFNKLRYIEESFKKQYHNTKRGLVWCVANTTLYFHKSPLCTTCIYKEDCKLTLKTNLPKIYKLRGYGEE